MLKRTTRFRLNLLMKSSDRCLSKQTYFLLRAAIESGSSPHFNDRPNGIIGDIAAKQSSPDRQSQ